MALWQMFAVVRLCPILFYFYFFIFGIYFSFSFLLEDMDCSTPGFSVLHSLLRFAQIHVH